MHLTKYSDYALRTLMFLAVRDQAPATIREIADTYNISRNHLMKIVHQLSTADLISAERGRGGGLRLARPAADINIGQVVRLTEDDLQIAECFTGPQNGCIISGHCALQGALNRALAAFLRELDQVTLADLTHNKRSLARRLSASA